MSASGPAPVGSAAWPNPAYGWYVTGVLLLAYTFSMLDRQVLNLLVEPIRADLDISDTQIGLLQGAAFVLTYVAMSVPVGRLVDGYNRVVIMIGGLLFWSSATIACGLSRTYPQLFAARLGLGAGEATLTPAAWSVLSDYFRPEKLPLPISVYLMGPYLGAGIALIAGAEVLEWTASIGQINLPLIGELAPWQFTFIAVGLPGFAIAALLLSVREPVRQNRERIEAPPWREVAQFLTRHWRIYLALLVGAPCLIISLYGLQGWVPAIMMRVHGWDEIQTGRYYGPIALIAGSVGVLSGPWIARFIRAVGQGDQTLRIAMAASLAAPASLCLLPLQSDAAYALGCIFLGSYFVAMPLALITSAMQAVTPNNMRGLVAGMYVVTANVIGLGLGSVLVAISTDYLFADTEAVAWSLALVSAVTGLLAAGLLAQGHRPYRQQLAA